MFLEFIVGVVSGVWPSSCKGLGSSQVPGTTTNGNHFLRLLQ